MASQVRTTYELTRAWIDAAVTGVETRVAPVGDAWERAGWGVGWKPFYAADHYHAASHGDVPPHAQAPFPDLSRDGHRAVGRNGLPHPAGTGARGDLSLQARLL